MRFAFALLLVSIGAAAFAAGFRELLGLWYQAAFHAGDVVTAMAGLPWWMRFGVPVLAGAIAGLIAMIRPSSRQGVSNVMEAVALGKVRLSLRATLMRTAASWVAMAGGLSIGREGPLIEFGGSLGAALGRLAGTPLDRTRELIAAGTAAGFAAAYNTPFAAVLFVFETIAGVAAPGTVVSTMAATVIATALTRAAVGEGPIFGQRAFALQSPWEFAAFAALGVLASAAALLFKRALARAEDRFERHPIPQPYRAALGGGIVGAIAIGLPAVAGNGYEPLNGLLDQRAAAGAVALLLVAKVMATSGSVASGVPGGIFTPMLLVGAAVGTLLAELIDATGLLPPVNAGSYALVGMAATTAASIHAPLTAAVLVFELSGDYPIVLPLLLATAVATSLSRWMGGESVYEAELRRRGVGWEMTLEGRVLK